MTNTPAHYFSISIEIFAPPEIIFDAWVKPELLKKWWFADPASSITEASIDAVSGGKIVIQEISSATHEQIDHLGVYLSLRPPFEIYFKLTVPKYFSGESEITVNIEPLAERTLMHFQQTGVPRISIGEKWKAMFLQLKLTVENQ